MRFRYSGKRDDDIPDHSLLSKYMLTEDGDDYTRLFSRYTHLVYGVCLKYLGNRDDSMDAVMQIFEKTVLSVKENPPDNYRVWLYVVAKNHSLMELRSRSAQKRREERWAMEQPLFMESDDMLHPLDRDNGEATEALKECIEQLNEKQRLSVEMFYFNEQSYREIAKHLNSDEKKVKSLLQNGKRNLKICLEGKNVR